MKMSNITIHRRTLLRDDNQIPFYDENSEFLSYIDATYVQSGKIIKFREKVFLDSNQLLLQISTTWVDSVHIPEFMMDPMCVEDITRMRQYNAEHNITLLHEENPPRQFMPG